MTTFDDIRPTTATTASLADDLTPQIDSVYDNTKERFENLMSEFEDSWANQINADIERVSAEIRNYQSTLNESTWRLNDLKNTKSRISAFEEDKKSENLDQFDKLLEHPKVEALGVSNRELVVKTVTLDMVHPNYGETKELGQLELRFPVAYSPHMYDRIYVVNVTGAKEDDENVWHHPHISDSGPCFGSYESTIVDVLSQGDYVAAFEHMLIFLQTINPEDEYGNHWDYWE